jgi:hypothetical protein
MGIELLRDQKGVYGIGPVGPDADALIPRPIQPRTIQRIRRPSWAEPTVPSGNQDRPSRPL